MAVTGRNTNDDNRSTSEIDNSRFQLPPHHHQQQQQPQQQYNRRGSVSSITSIDPLLADQDTENATANNDKDDTYRKRHHGYGPGPRSPELDVSWLTSWFLSWMNPLFKLGWQRRIQVDDLYEVMPQDKAKFLGDLLLAQWEKELSKSNQQTRRNAKKPRQPSLLKATVRTFLWRYMEGLISLQIGDILQFSTPMMMQQMLIFLRDIQDPTIEPPPDASRGFLLVLAITSMSTFMSFFYQLWNLGAMRVGLFIRTAMIDVIFRKATRLSNKSHLHYPDGAIINMMSVDVSRLDTCMQSVQYLVSLPIYLLVVITLVVRLMGFAGLVGSMMILLAGPIQAQVMGSLAPLRKKASDFADQRIMFATEILSSIKVVKMFAYENKFLDRLKQIREKELSCIRELWRVRSFISASSASLPVFASCVAFVVYVLWGDNTLDATIVFPALAYFSLIRVPAMNLLNGITAAVDGYVAIKRIEAFLLAEEQAPQPPVEVLHPYAISLENASFYWDKLPSAYNSNIDSKNTVVDERQEEDEVITPFLSRINLDIPRGSLVAIVGPVASGKSSLLQAMIGSMTKQSGEVILGASISYAPQTPWIQNATVRDNILFNQPYDPIRYQRVVKACSLPRDFSSFANGDLTELGERGINLSGGQKARLSLARAVYSRSGIILTDDPLSAVDAHVGRALWEDCFLGELMRENRTRIIATHQLHVLPEVDYVVYMQEGEIREEGTFKDLMENGQGFAKLMEQYGGVQYHSGASSPNGSSSSSISEVATEIESQSPSPSSSSLRLAPFSTIATIATPAESSTTKNVPSSMTTKASGSATTLKRRSSKNLKGSSKSTAANVKAMDGNGKLMQAEERETGAVKGQIYSGYVGAVGVPTWTLILTLFLLQQVAGVMYASFFFFVWLNVWLSLWTQKVYDLSLLSQILIYSSFALTQMLLVLAATWLMSRTVIATAEILHEQAFAQVILSPMSWFDQTPLGRILNRFSKDVETLDNLITAVLYEFSITTSSILGTLALISFYFPMILLFVIPQFFVYYFFSVYYRTTSREVKRLDSVLRSVLYSYFSESLNGLETLKAFGLENEAIEINQEMIDLQNRTYYLFQLGSRWISIRINFMGASLTCVTLLATVLSRDSIPPAVAGLILSYMTRINGDLNHCIQRISTLENNMNSAERLNHYIHNLETEKQPIETMQDQLLQVGNGVHTWPTTGTVEFKNVTMRYRLDLPPVLRDVSFEIRSGWKVGVVGRTGAGKSSLVQALFRLADLEDSYEYSYSDGLDQDIVVSKQSRILLDGIDTGSVGTRLLRSKIGIIPQDPVLFHGTMRYNLDPLGKHSEQELWTALEASDLKTFVQQQDGKLEFVVAAQGENLSVGQRQLVCLSRALLAKARVVVLDEATASVDMATDALIQRAIEKDFGNSTIISIAHRLNTVIGFDKILVMDQGCVAEYDSPYNLLQDPDSLFTALVDETGEQNATLLRTMANPKD